MSVIKKQHIYLPRIQLDLSKWSVIAAGQFSHDKEYWETVENYVSDSPTTFKLILPEIYFSRDNTERIKAINETMLSYFKNRLLVDIGASMILVNRSTQNHEKRLGIMLNVDLEEYNFHSDAHSLIKATEGTIVEKIPPRLEVRKDAIFELPHIILLYDDREQLIAEKLFQNRDKLNKLYDFNLNMGGGHLTGWQIKDVDEVIAEFDRLLAPDYIKRTFDSDIPILFVVGDGNHSLETAKEHWDKIKKNLSDEVKMSHPARFALVEAINIHDEGIEFKPIHRLVKNVKWKKFVKGLIKLAKINRRKASSEEYITQQIIVGDKTFEYDLPSNTPLAIQMVQDYIDNFLSKEIEMTVDYIHGFETLKEICARDKKSIGITLPTLDKNQLFEYVLKHGILPRKTFSIGEAREKRYYLEAHKIKLI